MSQAAMLGQSIGKWRVVKFIGGNQADYLGEDERGNQVRIRPNHRAAENADALEAAVAGQIAHPNIARVLALIADGELHWQVSEYVAGIELGRVLGSELADLIAAATWWVGDAAVGIAALHEHGRLHEWLALDNIYVSFATGDAVVANTGMMKLDWLPMTVTGTLAGQLRHLAPEQVDGSDGGKAADVWALAIAFIAMAAGAHPYRRHSDVETLRAICDGPPPKVPVGVSARVAEVVSAALESDPGARPSAAELATVLRAARTSTTTTGRRLVAQIEEQMSFD